MIGTFTVQQISSLCGYYLFHAFWQASLAGIAAIIFAKTCKFLPSNLRYGALIVALLKFAVPFLPPISIGLFNTMQGIGADIAVLNTFPEPRNSWLTSVLTIYVFGLLAATFNLCRQQRLLNAIRRHGNEINSGKLYEEFQELAKAMKFKQPPLLIISATTTVPFAYGLKTGIVVLPAVTIERLSLDELRPVLAHELAHLRHWDQWINWLQALLGSVWWFNPFYHLLSKVIREVREECRDDAVLAAGLASSSSYSRSMLAVAALAHPQPPLRIALHSLGHHPHPLAARLVRIADARITRRQHLTVSQLCLLILGALILLPGLTFKGISTVGEGNRRVTDKPSSFDFFHAHGPDSHPYHQQAHKATHKHH
jgi:beta-lactamase regulating signal transducer with metallopeptidase domain